MQAAGSWEAPSLPVEGPRLTAVPATAADVARLQAVLEGAPEYFVLTDGQRPGPDAARDLIAEAEADDCRRVLLLVPRAGGPAVGVLDLHLDYPEPRTAQVGLLLFRVACQGLGYGTETAAALEAGLARLGYRALRAAVVDENTDARAFWERHGFAPVGRLDGGVTLYEKPLA